MDCDGATVQHATLQPVVCTLHASTSRHYDAFTLHVYTNRCYGAFTQDHTLGMLISNFLQIRISDLKIRYKPGYQFFLHRPTSAVGLLITHSRSV